MQAAVTWKQLAAAITVVGALLGLFTVANSKVVVPIVAREARKEWRTDLREAFEFHTLYPHPGAAREASLEDLKSALEAAEVRLERQLSRCGGAGAD